MKKLLIATLLTCSTMAAADPMVRVWIPLDELRDAPFDLVLVNVTGAGVAGYSHLLSGCVSPDNMHGRGQGALALAGRRSDNVEVAVQAGDDRVFDLYGVKEATGEMFFLGSTTVTLTDNTQIRVPVTVTMGATPSVRCPRH
ncbi:MAG: hypothetical protein HY075_16135 [Deltaproteobacteria bacterium]|nr:hypothetical protein [Deltaproteobacteria bacterium]